MKLKTLAKLKLFSKETLINLEKLEYQGFCNINYKLKSSKKTYLLRVFKNSDTVNISREFEYKIQKKASKKGIAPKPLYLNKKYMVTQFEKGKHKESLRKSELKCIIKTIKKLHTIKTNTKVHSLQKDFKNYAKILKDKSSKMMIKESLIELKNVSKKKKYQVTTHHDLNPKNILFKKGRVKILDWEYTGKNSLFFDLATVCVEFELSKKMQEKVLKHYFGKIKKSHIQELKRFMKIYVNLCTLWFKSNEH